MSHSPLKMFRDYQYKHVLVIGQGPVDTIARSLGFSKVSSKLYIEGSMIDKYYTTNYKLINIVRDLLPNT